MMACKANSPAAVSLVSLLLREGASATTKVGRRTFNGSTTRKEIVCWGGDVVCTLCALFYNGRQTRNCTMQLHCIWQLKEETGISFEPSLRLAGIQTRGCGASMQLHYLWLLSKVRLTLPILSCLARDFDLIFFVWLHTENDNNCCAVLRRLAGHADAVQALLAGGADPRLRNSNGLTPLHMSAIGSAGKQPQTRPSSGPSNGVHDVIQQLISHDSTLLASKDEAGNTPLQLAIEEDASAATIKTLVEDRATPGYPARPVIVQQVAGTHIHRRRPDGASVLMTVLLRARKAIVSSSGGGDGSALLAKSVRAGSDEEKVLRRCRSLMGYLLTKVVDVPLRSTQGPASAADGPTSKSNVNVNVQEDRLLLAAVELDDSEMVKTLLDGHTYFAARVNKATNGSLRVRAQHQHVCHVSMPSLTILTMVPARCDRVY